MATALAGHYRGHLLLRQKVLQQGNLAAAVIGEAQRQFPPVGGPLQRQARRYESLPLRKSLARA